MTPQAPPIDQFKEKYGTVFLSQLGDLAFIWRALGRPEYDAVAAAATDEQDFEERLCQAALLWPDDWSFARDEAGAPKNLAPYIKEMSGFLTPKTSAQLLEAARNEINTDFTAQAEVAIKAAFPDVTFEQLRLWTLEKLMWYLARAEWKLNNIDMAVAMGTRIEFQISHDEDEATPSPKDYAASLREKGVDPMLQLDLKRLTPPYVEKPIIGGTRWQDEVIWDGVSKQVQRLSQRRKAIPEVSQ